MAWRLIVVEWVDAVWKTTLAKGLSNLRNAIYHKSPACRTQEQRSFYDRPDVSPKERFDFYLKANREDISRILELVEEGEDVVCDRLVSSTIVHHLSMDPFIDVHEAEELHYAIPKTQILLQASREVIMRRLSERWTVTRFEQDSSLFLQAQEGFLNQWNNLIIQTDLHNVDETLQMAHKFLSDNH